MPDRAITSVPPLPLPTNVQDAAAPMRDQKLIIALINLATALIVLADHHWPF